MKRFKYIIVGSGPGGSTVLKTLIDWGISDVAVIEEGNKSKNTVMGTYEELIEKYRYGGADIIFSKPNIAYAEGKTVGGGSEVNSGLYHRIPEDVLSQWNSERGINIDQNELLEHYEFIENWLKVETSDEIPSLISKKLIESTEKSDLNYEEIPRWKPLKSIFYDLKEELNLIENTKVVKIIKSGEDFKLICLNKLTKNITELVCSKLIIAAGTFETPKLLKFSGYKLKNNSFSIHPHIKVGAKFDKSLYDGEKVSPYQVKYSKYNSSFGTSINSRQWKALFLSENINTFKKEIPDIDNIGIFYNAIRPYGKGSIKYLKSLNTNILTYKFLEKDIENLIYGTRKLIQLLQGIGATKIILPTSLDIDQSDILKFTKKQFKSLSIHTVHTFSSMAMGDHNSNTDSNGIFNDDGDILISDSSILPGPPGVNPQGPLMALCRRNAIKFIEKTS